MQLAVSVAATLVQQSQGCWLPPASIPGSSQLADGLEPPALDQHLQRWRELQPTVDAVGQVAAGMTELGSQRLNDEQRSAVAAILSGAARAMPYALHGPPGRCALLPAYSSVFSVLRRLWP